jgi:protein-tyrosine phosphatase
VIDIHCHIIPGVDDGVPGLDEALTLIRKEATGGTEAFIATPHFIDRRDYERLQNIDERVQELVQAVAEAGIQVEIYPGGEIYPTMAIFQALDKGASLTLAGKGKHMLIDLPMGALPNDFDGIIYELRVRGIVPIIAHPERNGFFQESPDRMQEYMERGAAFQVNAGSLKGKYGPRAKEVVELILSRQWASFLSSDAHRAGGDPIMGTARTALKSVVSDEYLDVITRGSAEAVIRGDVLPEIAHLSPVQEKKGWFSRIRRR